MKLFIDTNIYLSFYHFTDDDLDSLGNLEILIEENEIDLYIPDQVKKEFIKNRDNKLNTSMNKFEEQNISLESPRFCQTYSEYEELVDLKDEYNQKHSKLIEDIQSDVLNEELKADEIIRGLFDKGSVIECSNEILEAASKRSKRGKPPEEHKNLGDTINWVSLLKHITNGEDLHFISRDNDFSSNLQRNKFNTYLKKEWNQKKNSELVFYRSLTKFLKEHFKQIKLSEEPQKQLLIEQLSKSASYSRTHSIISKLTDYGNFSEVQVNDIISAYLYNDQVYQIVHDDDVYNFLNFILNNYEKDIEEEKVNKIRNMLEKSDNTRDEIAKSIL
jgi:hypothetical protein